MFQLPDSFKTTKRHLIGYNIESDMNENFLLQQELFACSPSYDPSTVPSAGNCMNAEWIAARSLCKSVALGNFK